MKAKYHVYAIRGMSGENVNYINITWLFNRKPFKPSRCIKASYYLPENILYFPTTRGFRMTISAKLAYQYTNTISFNCSTTSNHLHPLQVKNCDSNSRLVVDEDDNGKFRLEIVR